MYQIESCSPADPDALALLDRLSAALAAITGSSGRSSFDPSDVMGARALFVIARDGRNAPLGCGAYRPLSPSIAEVKRMYAAPGTIGLGAAILAFLEVRAAADGYEALWLETRLVNDRAVRFYERRGYARIPNFGKYIGRPEAVCFGKRLQSIESASSAAS
jgi:GNAT superfamily N-acetyltransferase